MNAFTVAPYGSWKSPLTADTLLAGAVRLSQILLDGHDLYWTEGRPSEGGRNVLIKQTPDGKRIDLTPAPFNVRTRVHEYGGGGYAVREGVVYFSNFADQRLYRQVPGTEPQPVTPETAVRFADGVFAGDLFICVREDHRQAGVEAVSTLVSLKLDGEDAGTVLVEGGDFYASPCVSPDGKKLAWLTWNHPNMPWDGTELWVADLVSGQLLHPQQVAGGIDESIFQPEWSPDGSLHFVSDRSGWWNLYRWDGGEVWALYPMQAEFGFPQWQFGMRSYAFADPHTIICSVGRHGRMRLGKLDTQAGELAFFDLPFTEIRSVQVAAEKVVFDAASPTMPASIVYLNWQDGSFEVVRQSSAVEIDAGYISAPQAVEFPTSGGLTAHAFYYPPQNKDYQPPAGELPPLLVLSHGGPTSAVFATMDLAKLYWTSRGFGVLDVNYGGSTGYGRAYRQRLNGQWGIVDVVDCINGALYLADQKIVDAARLAIRGGSAGGYTTLCALTFHDVFKAGASYFGVSDAEALAKDTHKFESRYLDNLIGPYPERRDLYIERSPIYFADQINCPLILLQGLEDEVVPASQAELMYTAVKTKGIPVAYLPFAGEQHGFRRSENIKRSLEAELYFYSKVFGFGLADSIEPLQIENLSI